MSGFLDFDAIKRSVTFGETVQKLGLQLKQHGNQWRGPCPQCKSGGDRALVVTEGKGFFCFAQKAGGDQIALAAHILGVSVKEGAAFLAGESKVQDRTRTVPGGAKREFQGPESESGQQGTRTMQPLSYLEPEHLAVEAIGFDPDFAKQHGIGYAGRGTMRGFVLVPFRDQHGQLLGYLGITEAQLPKDFTTNIVKFPKTA